jgi:hypothetical protein
MATRIGSVVGTLCCIAVASCTADDPATVQQAATGPGSIGWDIYFKRTYGNEVFLTQV